MSRRAPTLGVFDSGIGGLTVVRHLRRLLPAWRIVYFGDTARVPYGTKSEATVRRFAGEAARFLTQFDVGHLVVACNTVSAVALRSLTREFHGLPIDGVIEPGAEAAVKATRSGRIGVIGTRATVASRAYEHAITEAARHAAAPRRAAGRRHAAVERLAGAGARVYAHACPLLVPLAEEGMANSKAAREVLREYLEPLRRRRIDTLILGCTHYPPFKASIRSVLGPRVTLIDSGEATARRLARTLRRNGAQRPRGRGSLRCYVSDIPRQFEAIGRRFLGHRLGRVWLVPQDDLPWFERRPIRGRE
ncbi:MAG: glutamate racemase [Candidatus Latescibacteria bacterium]|nr:glutamate racemase [Candidatus Latescibacterota bacterium]